MRTAGVAAALAALTFGGPGFPALAPDSGPVQGAPYQAVGSAAAHEVRASLGIEGRTKGSPTSVIVSAIGPHGVRLSAVQVETGTRVPLPAGAHDAAAAPGSDTVAAVGDGGVLLVDADRTGATARVVASGGTAAGGLSWGSAGTALYARVSGRWVEVHDPSGAQAQPGTAQPWTVALSVPAVPGGPTFLSVSPSGDLALLFGITARMDQAAADRAVRTAAKALSSLRSEIRTAALRDQALGGLADAKPHLYLGSFDGRNVTKLHLVDIPSTALEGPLGWLGDNAFLISPGPGSALIVRVDGTRVSVVPPTSVTGCATAPAVVTCSSAAPSVLGTNGDGSLLVWRASGSWVTTSGRPVARTLYFETWLDGTHATRLTGPEAVYGPPVAAR
jgi:hypothetical protein